MSNDIIRVPSNFLSRIVFPNLQAHLLQMAFGPRNDIFFTKRWSVNINQV